MSASKLPWIPWHQVVRLRDDLRSGELSLAIFAADLYDVAMGKARPVYQEPREFFALTYPTFNLRELARDVVRRLAAQNDKAVRQLVLTYGGGKTHALITLLHLVNDPSHLPKLPAVQEFIQHIGFKPPRARVAVLAFDKLDVEKGMEVQAPDGERRRLVQPWSVLAFQIAGAEGLRLLHAEERDAERDSAPAENLLVELLTIPAKEGLSTLVLIDEVLMYAREKVGMYPQWRGRLLDFFQYLTQAATKVDTCAVVASLLATDPRKSDTLGKEMARELFEVFRREQEQAVEPVVKDDVAEVLRRRFFTPESIRDRESFRPHVIAALQGIANLDEQTAKEKMAAEERFVQSYPLHPDLTEVFYSKWTNLEGFQRTRGVLRTFALALRNAEAWDTCPLIGAGVFLAKPGDTGISEAARELMAVAEAEEYEGKTQAWTGILQGELAKAREVQVEYSQLRHREVEQAVFATFLHSQPIGQKALLRDLMLLLGPTRPDKIELEKALRHWAEISWFLDEEMFQETAAGPEGQKPLPRFWRLGSRPNLRQMHDDACQNRVSDELVEVKLLEEICSLKSLTAGASAAGARVHNLPEKPSEIDDDGEFHYAVLGPKAVSEQGRPSDLACRMIRDKTTDEYPRTSNRNAIVLVASSGDGLEAARSRVRDYLGWEDVRSQLAGQKLEQTDPVRWGVLSGYLEESKRRIPDAIRQAYCIVVTLSEKNENEAFKVTVGDEPLFQTVKNDRRSRIQDTPINAEALLPGGPYELWQEGETTRWAKDLVGAFAQFARLPKMLNTEAILDTLVNGCMEGIFVFRLVRPDRSVRTFWRESPDEEILKDSALEVVLLEAASLTYLPSALLVPEALPQLWPTPEITLKDLYDYFSGKRVVQVQREGYEEPMLIPRGEREVIQETVGAAVREGKLWLLSGPASLLAEEIPAGLLSDDAQLQAPPAPISPLDLLPDRLPEAWGEATQTTAQAIIVALSKQVGKNLPWVTVRDAISGALRGRMLELVEDSCPWPCDYARAQQVRLRLPTHVPPPPPPPPRRDVWFAEAELEPHQIQDLAEVVGDIVGAAVGYNLEFRLYVELGGKPIPPSGVAGKVSEVLKGVSENLVLQKGDG